MAKDYPELPNDILINAMCDVGSKYLVIAQIADGKRVSKDSEFASNGKIIYAPTPDQQRLAAAFLRELNNKTARFLQPRKKDYQMNRQIGGNHYFKVNRH